MKSRGCLLIGANLVRPEIEVICKAAKGAAHSAAMLPAQRHVCAYCLNTYPQDNTAMSKGISQVESAVRQNFDTSAYSATEAPKMTTAR